MNGSDPKQIARELLEEAHPALIGLSHWIHANPELGYQEVLASGWVTEWLATAGFDVRTGVAGMPTSIVGSYGPGPFHVAVCVEYDALPAVGHACGHNVIAAAGVGAGLALAAVADELGLKVTVMGTPAEETGGGKIGLIKAGEFDGVHAAMMVHPWPQDEATPSIIAIRSLEVTYTGKEAHAAGFPYLGINAADALVIAQTAIALLRQQLRSTDRVHGIVTKGGDAANIIPARTQATWMVRGTDVARLDEVTTKVRRCFEAGALATGATLEIVEEICYADVRHHTDLAALYKTNAEALGRTLLPAGMPVSTDMGNVSYVVPTIHPMIGIEANGAVNHQADFAAACATPSADQAIFDGALAMAWTAIDAAQDPALRERLMAFVADPAEVAMVSQAWLMPPHAAAVAATAVPTQLPPDVVPVDADGDGTPDPVAEAGLDPDGTWAAAPDSVAVSELAVDGTDHGAEVEPVADVDLAAMDTLATDEAPGAVAIAETDEAAEAASSAAAPADADVPLEPDTLAAAADPVAPVDSWPDADAAAALADPDATVAVAFAEAADPVAPADADVPLDPGTVADPVALVDTWATADADAPLDPGASTADAVPAADADAPADVAAPAADDAWTAAAWVTDPAPLIGERTPVAAAGRAAAGVAATALAADEELDPDAAWARDVDAVAQQMAAAGFLAVAEPAAPQAAPQAEPPGADAATDDVLFIGFEDTTAEPATDVVLLDAAEPAVVAPVAAAEPEPEPILDVWVTPEVLGEWLEAPAEVVAAADAGTSAESLAAPDAEHPADAWFATEPPAPAVAAAPAVESAPPVAPAVAASPAVQVAPPAAPAPAQPMGHDAWQRAFEEAAARIGWEEQFNAAISERMTQEGMDRSEAIEDLASDLQEAAEERQATGAAAPAWPPQATELVSREHIEAEGFSFVAPDLSAHREDRGDVWSRNGADHATEDLPLG